MQKHNEICERRRAKNMACHLPQSISFGIVFYFLIWCCVMMSERTMVSDAVMAFKPTFSWKSLPGLQEAPWVPSVEKFYWNICLHGSVAFNLLLFISFRLIYFFTFVYLLNLITPQIPAQTCCCSGLREARGVGVGVCVWKNGEWDKPWLSGIKQITTSFQRPTICAFILIQDKHMEWKTLISCGGQWRMVQ